MPDIGHVFLVGCPRSGTTLVQSMLAAHNCVYTLPETHFFSRIIPTYRWARRLRMTDSKVRQFLAGKIVEITGSPDLGPKGMATLWVSSYGKSFARFLDAQAKQNGKAIWVEKTPQHLHRIPQILGGVPDAKFVHILRAGADTIASLYHVTHEYPERWGGAQSIDDCAERWIRDINVSRGYCGQPQHHFLIYDDLIRQPERVLEKLCDFSNTDYQNTMLKDSSAAYHDSVAENDAEWTGNAGRPLYEQKDGKFISYLTDEQRSRITHALHAAGLADLPAIFAA